MHCPRSNVQSDSYHLLKWAQVNLYEKLNRVHDFMSIRSPTWHVHLLQRIYVTLSFQLNVKYIFSSKDAAITFSLNHRRVN